jgi:indolepyruvate ferredoxin oxidoreductase
MGDGTYFHSGLLAIRAAVTAGVHITYKILVNGAVAMTGGQPIEGEPLEGEVTVPEIARQLAAEGVRRIAVVSDDPGRYPSDAGFPDQVSLHHRDELDRVQRELREAPGVSALIYDQTCAAEARRLRKRGALPDPDRRIVIHEGVCEGCGDCSAQSNCISIEPVETEFGRKRRINQSSCNKDYSCLKGHCPSFVSVIGGRLREARGEVADPVGDVRFAELPEPPPPDLSQPFNVLVTGIGGSGVVTVGALLGMAAHLEGRGVSTLDVTGLAQKNGPVTSHVRIAADPGALHATRISAGAADLVLGCDIVVSAGADALSRMAKGRTTALVNRHVAPTFEFAANPDLDLSPQAMEAAIAGAVGAESCHVVDATAIATALMGDAIFTNPFLMGYAYQEGRLPVGRAALERAVELNGRAVEQNRRAFAWGRLAAHDPAAVERALGPARREEGVASSREARVARRVAFLTDYQDAAWAGRYRALVDRVAARERQVCGGEGALSEAVVRYHFKLLAYKDEYEVARLLSDPAFRQQIESRFEGDYRLEWHAAPPHIPVLDRLLRRRDRVTGRTRKIAVGGWVFRALPWLARLRFLRGTPLDPFGRTPHRRAERALIAEYEAIVEELLEGLTPESRDLAAEIASLPERIRGFDSVKDRHLEEVRARQAELLAAFRRPSAA